MSLQEYAEKVKDKSNKYSTVLSACKILLKKNNKSNKSLKYLKTRVSKYNIDKFEFGFFPKTEDLGHLYSYIDRDVLLSLKLITDWKDNNSRCLGSRDISFFNYHNIVFPSYDEHGSIIGLIGRTILSDSDREKFNQPKYKYTYFNRGLHLFGLNKARRSIEKRGCAIIVEGQIDCISCHSNGFPNVVALGGSSLGDYQIFLLKKYTDTIYLLLDNDSAGEKASAKILEKYSENINIKKLKLPSQYKDVDEYLKSSSDYRIFERLNSGP